MKKKNEIRKMNNSGFSLVELIIVVAIMAILVGVLAPQYMKYVERSRRSTDMQNATAIVSAIQIYSADPEIPATARIANNSTILLSATADPAFNPVAGTSFIDEALTNAGIVTTGLRLRSTSWNTNAGNVTLTVTVAADGTVSVASDDESILTGITEPPANGDGGN